MEAPRAPTTVDAGLAIARWMLDLEGAALQNPVSGADGTAIEAAAAEVRKVLPLFRAAESDDAFVVATIAEFFPDKRAGTPALSNHNLAE